MSDINILGSWDNPKDLTCMKACDHEISQDIKAAARNTHLLN